MPYRRGQMYAEPDGYPAGYRSRALVVIAQNGSREPDAVWFWHRRNFSNSPGEPVCEVAPYGSGMRYRHITPEEEPCQ